MRRALGLAALVALGALASWAVAGLPATGSLWLLLSLQRGILQGLRLYEPVGISIIGEAGARVADVGCGLGASTIILAKAFPRSRFFGFDYHEGSIETARQRAREAGVADRVTFAVAQTIVAEAALSFLGLSVPPSIPSWGGMLADGRSYIVFAWWLAAIPGLAITTTVIGVNLLGDWLRDHLDPRLAV